jgi:hypothetical protein
VLRTYARFLAGLLENSAWCERVWHGRGDCMAGKLEWFARTGEWAERVLPVHGEDVGR